jgi:hypothetical protein
MESYHITNYSRRRAKQCNVKLRPSNTKGKKVDVFDFKGKKLASVGALGMMDYPTYILKKGRTYANKRRRLYTIRHKKDMARRGSPGYWAKKILW